MIGILPCAGKSERIHGLPKYLLPCPPNSFLLKSHCEAMYKAGIDQLSVGTNPDNYELLSRLAYHYPTKIPVKHYGTMTETVLSIRDNAIENSSNEFESHPVVFGMPDTYFDVSPYEQLSSMLEAQQDCDLLIGLFNPRPNQHEQGGMVRIERGEIVEVIDKPETISRGEWYIWGAMAWKPSFWDCLTPNMPHVGFGIQRAIDRGLSVHTTVCLGGFYDCGTPERYFEMIRATTCDLQSA